MPVVSSRSTRAAPSGRGRCAHWLRSARSTPPAVATQTTARSPPLEVATLATCWLAGGATLPACRVAYRRYGRLAADRDNVELVPTFFSGKSEDHLFWLGTHVNTTRHLGVIVDALADGYSSFPSNTPGGAAVVAALPIGEMVDVQHRLLTEHLGIQHLRAVVAGRTTVAAVPVVDD